MGERIRDVELREGQERMGLRVGRGPSLPEVAPKHKSVLPSSLGASLAAPAEPAAGDGDDVWQQHEVSAEVEIDSGEVHEDDRRSECGPDAVGHEPPPSESEAVLRLPTSHLIETLDGDALDREIDTLSIETLSIETLDIDIDALDRAFCVA